MESKNKFWKGVLIGSLVTAFAGLVIVGMSAGIFLVGRSMIHNQVQAQSSDTPDGEEIPWSQVESKSKRIQKIVQEYFLFDEDKKEVEEFIYKGLMAGLGDPYSVYYTQEEFADLMEDTSGEYCGIGAMVSKNMNTGAVSIAKVFKGTPAEEAGLQNGDIFYQVDDVEVTTDMDLDILVKQHVKGEEGSVVHLKMYRPSLEDFVEMDVIRRQIEVPTVEWEMLAENVGYITISQFDEITSGQFAKALDELESQGMEGLLIDLRGNPGGVLDAAVEMIDYMLPDDLDQYAKEEKKTLIVSTADKNEKGQKYYCEDGHSVEVPTVILVDGNSASASEVFSGALRDYDRADLVGTTTFGKGIVQTLLPLGDGSAVKLTTAHYYSPSGFDLHGIGLEPDVEVAYEPPKTEKADAKAEKGAAKEQGEENAGAGRTGEAQDVKTDEAQEEDRAQEAQKDETGQSDSQGDEDGETEQDGTGTSKASDQIGDSAAAGTEEEYDNQMEKALEVLKEKMEKAGRMAPAA